MVEGYSIKDREFWQMFSIVNIYCRTETELGEIITELE